MAMKIRDTSRKRGHDARPCSFALEGCAGDMFKTHQKTRKWCLPLQIYVFWDPAGEYAVVECKKV